MIRIKVLVVAADPAPGMVPFVATIANTLTDDDRFDIYALVTNTKHLSYTKNFSKKIKVVSIEYPAKPFKKLLFKLYSKQLFDAFSDLIKRIQPDVVHIMVGDFVFANYNLNRYSLNKKTCVTVHDLYPHERERIPFKERLIRKIMIYQSNKFISKIGNLTTSSLSQFSELKKLYPKKNICYTHFPTLVTSAIKQGRMCVTELKNIDNYILFFGSVEKYKGVDLLIDAFSSLKMNKDIKLVIAGKGDVYDSRNPNIIRLNRFIEDEEIADLFMRSLFVVYPYISATMSGVLSLAYYFRKRVLLSDVQFFKDNKTPSCTFFRNGDSYDLKEKLNQMICQNVNLQTEDYYKSIYSDKVLADDYFSLYSNIINNM